MYIFARKKAALSGSQNGKTEENNRGLFTKLCLIFPCADFIMKALSGEKWRKVHILPTKMERQTKELKRLQEVKSFDR